jgi:GTP cyclohydrolase I
MNTHQGDSGIYTSSTCVVDDSSNCLPPFADSNYQKLFQAARLIIEAIGEDPNREGLLLTPERFARSMLFMTKGYHEDLNQVIKGAIFEEPSNTNMVVVRNIEISSLCEHHIIPFMGKVHIGYIPKRKVLGLSKLARISDHYSRRLQLQERLTSEIAHAILESIDTTGVAVIMEATHMCMSCRGIQKPGAQTITICALGEFKSDSNLRDYFIKLTNSTISEDTSMILTSLKN